MMYSSLRENQRKEVINKCYWPIFEIVKEGIPVGIEAPALTLAIISKLDYNWKNKLKKYILDKKIEFIGSGFSQIIGPLVPSTINKWNQRIGSYYYQNLLNIKPKIGLVNEMAFSNGILEHYILNDYKGLIMEWNNPYLSNPNWEKNWKYSPHLYNYNNKKISIVWSNSIYFQKFQRYAHGELNLNDYIDFIKKHVSDETRYFPLYTNDVEIFNFRPGRYKTEARLNKNNEWERIIKLYKYLNKQSWCEFVFIEDIIKNFNKSSYKLGLDLTSPNRPIPVKKQEKYNINRWALTGRNDLLINTQCYQIYNLMVLLKIKNIKDWEKICYLWSSDFRTHISTDRWSNYKREIKKTLKKFESKNPKLMLNRHKQTIKKNDKYIILENKKFKLILNSLKGLCIKDLYFKDISKNPLIGTINHGFYEDITLCADYFSGHAVIERFANHKITDLNKPEITIRKNLKNIQIESIHDEKLFKINRLLKLYDNQIVIHKTIKLKFIEKLAIFPFIFTFKPECWDFKSLYIETNSGGNVLERFKLYNQKIQHAEIYSTLITSRHGFGNTEGLVIIGDENKSIKLNVDMSVSALIPKINFWQLEDTFFFRLIYSACEIDETLKSKKINFKNKLTIS
jgi:hypothetical protein